MDQQAVTHFQNEGATEFCFAFSSEVAIGL
jgi:hypothetical protein